MNTTPKELHPELLRILGVFSGWPADRMTPSTHVVFDLGIDGSDIDALIENIESQFKFVGTDAEWQAPRTVGDINELVAQLHGKHRPEVRAERDAKAAVIRRRNRIVIGAVLGWLGFGAVAFFTSRQRWFAAWVAVTVCWCLFSLVRSNARVARARRRWKRERLARYGV